MNSILEVFLNTLWQTAAVALLAWVALRLTPSVNAATRETVWWAVLAFVVLLPVMRAVPVQRPIPREASSVFVAAPSSLGLAPEPVAAESVRRGPAVRVVLP